MTFKNCKINVQVSIELSGPGFPHWFTYLDQKFIWYDIMGHANDLENIRAFLDI